MTELYVSTKNTRTLYHLYNPFYVSKGRFNNKLFRALRSTDAVKSFSRYDTSVIAFLRNDGFNYSFPVGPISSYRAVNLSSLFLPWARTGIS